MHSPLCRGFRRTNIKKLTSSFLTIVFFELLLLNFAPHAQAQKWVNPCSTVHAGDQATALKGNERLHDVCSYLDRTFMEVNNRCGISFGTNVFHPSTWSKNTPYRVIPVEVIQDLPRTLMSAQDAAD